MKTIDKRIEELEKLLSSIQLCTQPIENHSDPNSINDCWNEVNDVIASIKSASKRNVFITWNLAIGRIRNENNYNYEQVSEQLGTIKFHYLKEDNQAISS